MKRIFAPLLLIAAISLFNACVTDSKSSGDSDDSDESGQVTQGGARKPRTPKVSYETADSLVGITIQASKPGEESKYWIRRDGKLLDQPEYANSDFTGGVYVLVDSLTEKGKHTYNVQYGPSLDSLSDKSPDWVYDYAGHSRSGWVKAIALNDEMVSIRISLPSDEVIGKIIVERRIGAKGDEVALDTVEIGGLSVPSYTDTNLVPEDTYLFYRVRAMDAFADTLLAPSPWDSILVKNEVWKYLPTASVAVGESEVMATVTNSLFFAGKTGAFYYLYRNDSEERKGKTAVDSIPVTGMSALSTLRDLPEPGDYYYWVEATDPWGRVSARSTPKSVRFTGRPKGPAISFIQSSESNIQIQLTSLADARLYILERTQDTAKAAKAIDTLTISSNFVSTQYFVDYPTVDGYYYYRVVSVDAYGERSEPGDWKVSGYYHYNPSFGTLTVGIANRGDRVQAAIQRAFDYYYVMYRSKSASGPDTAGVDTLRYSDTATTLKDVPPVGTWYYRVYRYSANPNSGGTVYRSASARIEFTGKPTGAAILSLNVTATRIDIIIAPDPDALAYILDRSPDGKDWTVADTASAIDYPTGYLRDRPPEDGYWNYRVRVIRGDLVPTPPGASMRTTTYFTYGPTYSNTLSATIENKGSRVECPMSPVYSYVIHLMRSPTSDMEKGIKVDSLVYPGSSSLMKDTPDKGTYYYWVQRSPVFQEGTIYRSVPVKVTFTGSPEITSLAKVTQGIQVTYPILTADTLEIYRSTGNPEDKDSFTLITSIPPSPFPFTSYYIDALADKKSGFYHYRLVSKSEGKVSEPGSVKSIYYDPAPSIY